MAFDLVAAYAQADTPFFVMGQPAQVLSEAPQQITLRFSPGVKIDASTLANNILVQRSGGAGDGFGPAGTKADVSITPGSLTVDDLPNENQVVIRFAETPLDDTYRITISGGLRTLPQGAVPAESFSHAGVSGYSFAFRVNLGAFVVAVVPQPVTRPGSGLAQSRDTIEVFFNRNDPLDESSAQNPSSYRLFEVDPATGTDAAPLAPVNPSAVAYSSGTGKATLSFAAGAIADDKLYRLQIGSADALVAAAAPVAEGSDDNSSFTTAQDLGSLSVAGASVSGTISPRPSITTPAGSLAFTSQPGTIDEPGHRDTPADSGQHGLPEWMTRPATGATVGYYNFKAEYGVDAQGNTLYNAITENQKQRAREIFELFSRYTGCTFVETADQGLTVVTGDVRAADPKVPPTAVAGIGGNGLAIMNAFLNWGNSEYAEQWFVVAMHEIGHAIGLQHSYDLPSIMGSGLAGESVFPGDYDVEHLRQLYPAEGSDIDVYKFSLPTAGKLSAETVVARPGTAATSPLDTVLTLYREQGGKRELIARNDDFYGRDSFIGLDLEAGNYFIAVTSKGNTAFNPEVSDSGSGGSTAGGYSLKLGFAPRSTAATTIVDTSQVAIDGDRDGKAGGAFSFWFNTAASTNDPTATKTVFVDKTAPAGGNGTLLSPYRTLKSALDAVEAANAVTAGSKRIIRIAGNDTDAPYLVGLDRAGRPLADGATFNVPKDVTVIVDAGAIFKLRAAVIDVGSSSPLVQRGGAALQILGTPDRNVRFTSYHNDSIGGDSDGVGPAAGNGDWGGIVFRKDSDSSSKRAFVNTVAQASIGFGGGQVVIDSVRDSFAPIQLESARPTIAFNTITRSAGAALAADPNSFEESAGRSGPEIRGNRLLDNTTNGLFVKIRTAYGSPIDTLDVPARLRSNDIVYVLQENLLINGGVGGYVLNPTTGLVEARRSGRLAIDPGVVVKLQGSRIELGRGKSQLFAEGTANNRVIFTSLGDNRFGAGGTFDTNGNLPDVRTAGDWGGVVLNAGATASIDHAYIAFGGGQTPIEGTFDQFNVIEVHQGDLRLAHSRIENNAAGTSTSSRSGRGSNVAATIFVRGAQPVILENDFRDNLGAVVSINANSLIAAELGDPGRSTGRIDRSVSYDDNRGPLVRGNRLSSSFTTGGAIGGMLVRGEQITVESVWDDTDIVHVLQSEIVVQNFHTATGILLVSRPDASLVVKLSGPDAGFTAAGYGLDINDRIGGTVQVVGQPGYPVILTALADDTVGASLDPLGRTVKDTGYDGATTPKPGDWRSLKFLPFSNDRNVSVVLESEKPAIGTSDVNGSTSSAQSLGVLAPNFATAGNSWESAQEKSGDDNRRLGFEIHGRIATDNPGDVDVYTFTGYSGSEVWIDVDKTSGSLDSMVEILDAAGRVIARSADGQTDAALAAGTRGIGQPLDKDAWRGGDFYTLNPKDPGMRAVLPSLAGQAIGTLTQYYIRIRSQPRYEPVTVGSTSATTQAAFEADLANPAKLTSGATSGSYELRVRLRQQDEKPGSTVRYADIRYPTVGIDVQGLPRNSLLTGETGENAVDANDAFTSAQYVGNLLQSDRNTISIAGAISSAADVDWYTFALNYEQIQAIGGVNAGAKTWATVFDIDYGDGFRGDLTLSVYDSNGQLLYVGRDSNVKSDQPAAGQGANFNDTSRGSAGKLDPFIGSVQMKAGTPTGAGSIEDGAAATPPDPTKQLRYYVAVSSNERLPSVLDASLNAGSTNTLVRLEPVNSVTRIAEDHIGFTGYTSGDKLNPTPVPPANTAPLIDIASLDLHVTPFTLSDVTLFVSGKREYLVDGKTVVKNTLATVDPVRGNLETTIAIGTPGDIRDLAMRSDGKLYAYEALGAANTAGRLSAVDAGNGAITVVGNDSIPDPNPILKHTDGPLASITKAVSVSATKYQLSTPNVIAGSIIGSVRLQNTIPDPADATKTVTLTGAWDFTFDATGSFVLGNADPQNSPGIATPVSLGSSVDLVTAAVTIAWSANVAPANTTLLSISYQTQVPNVHAVATNNVDALAIQRLGTGAYSLFYSVRDGSQSRLYTGNATTGNAATGRVGTGYIQDAGNSIGIVTGMAFSQGQLYGVDDRGQFIVIDSASGGAAVLNAIPGVSFQGLAAGPQNVEGGRYKDFLFAIDTDGVLRCFDDSGNLQTVFDGNGDGIADATTIPTGFSNATGLAFSPLDINLWHPTFRRSQDAGHGVPVTADATRTGELRRSFGDYNGFSWTSDMESQGAQSMYFGLEKFISQSGTRSTYYTGPKTSPDDAGQYGASAEWQADLTSNPDIGDNYNLPGGAYGSLVTHGFDLSSYDYTDKPTVYFNYWLQTENASGAYDKHTMRDSARVLVSTDQGLTWQLIATNNSQRSDIDTSKGELPAFWSASSRIANSAIDNQHVQELFDTSSWRQARVDLGRFAGNSDVRLRFDFSTAGALDPNQRDAAGNLLNSITGYANTTGAFSDDMAGDLTSASQRGQNNKFEGFYVDDIIVGLAERGEMVTGAATKATGFFDIGTPTGKETVPAQLLQGPYQLEIRRGTEYGSQPDKLKSTVVIDQTFDSNADLVASNGYLGDANAVREQGQFLIENNIVSSAATYGVSIDAGLRDAGTNAPVPGVPRNLPTLNNNRLVPGVVVANNVIASSGISGVFFSGDPNTGVGPLAAVPFGRILNNTIYGGPKPQGIGVTVTENAGPTLLNNLFANLATGVNVDASSAPNTVIGASAYFAVPAATEVVGDTQSQRIQLSSNPFVNAAARNFYLAAGSAAIDSSVNSLGDRPAVVAVTSPLGIPESPILAPDRDLYGQLRSDDPGVTNLSGLGSNVFKDRGAIDRVDFTQPYAAVVAPVDNDADNKDKNPAIDSIRLETADARGITKFVIQLSDVGVGIDPATVVSSAFTVRRDGFLLTDKVDYTFNYLESSNRVVFESASVFRVGTYLISVAQTRVAGLPTNVISDIAGNPLLPNQADGTTTFSIALADAPTVPSGLTGTVDDSRVQLTWNASTSDGTPLVRYEVQYAVNESFTGATTVNVDPANLSLLVTPLVNHTQYWFRVRAVNDVGASDWSTPVGPLVPLPPPSAPTITAVLDDVAPVTGSVTNGGFTNDTVLVLSGSTDAGTTVDVFNGATKLGAATVTGTTWIFTTATLTNGTTYSFTAKATDAASTTGPASGAFVITIDTTPPAAPTLALANDTGFSNTDSVTNDGTVVVGALEPSGRWEYSTNGGTTWSTGAGSTFLLPPDVYAIGRIRVRQIDLAGNVSSERSNSVAITVDTTAPAALTLALAADTGASNSDGVTNDGRVTVTGVEPGARWDYSLDGGSSWSRGNATTFTLPPGIYPAGRIVVRQADVAGNQGVTAANSDAIEVDTTAAAPQFVLVQDTGVSAADQVTRIGSVRVSGVEASGSWRYSTDGGTSWSGWQPAATATFTLPEGTYDPGRIRIQQLDLAGNQSVSASNTSPIVIDTTIPTAPAFRLLNDTGISAVDGRTNDGRLLLTDLEPNGGWQVSTNGGVTWTSRAPNTVNVYTLPEGTYPAGSVLVRQLDLAGNRSTTNSNAVAITVNTVAPAVTVLTSPLPDGTYGVGQEIPITVTFSKPVFVAGTPRIALNTTPTRYASYSSGHGTATLTFMYRPSIGDKATDLSNKTGAIILGGGSIRDRFGNDAMLTLPDEGSPGSLGANKNIAINAIIQATAPGLDGTIQSTATRSITIKFNAPVTGVTLNSFKLAYSSNTVTPAFRSVSLRGATLTGSGDTYTLTLPSTATSLKGLYRLEIGGPNSGIVSGGVPMTDVTTIYWRRT